MARLGCPGSAPSALPASPTTFCTSLLPATAAAAPPTTPAATFVALAFFSGLIRSPFWGGGLGDDPGAADVPPSLLDTCQRRMSEQRKTVMGNRHHLWLGRLIHRQRACTAAAPRQTRACLAIEPDTRRQA